MPKEIKEGWGMATCSNRPNRVYITDGTGTIKIYDIDLATDKLKLVNELRVRFPAEDLDNFFSSLKSNFYMFPVGSSDPYEVNYLNELECVDDRFLFVNVYVTHYILKIDLSNGIVRNVYDFSDLVYKVVKPKVRDFNIGMHAFNGIAYDGRRSNKLFYLTGKDWPDIYKVELLGDGDFDESNM